MSLGRFVKNGPRPSAGVRRRMTRMGIGGAIGGAILVLLILVAAIGPALTPSPNTMNIALRFQPPSAGHLMGTDQFGRDILSRVVVGARLSLVAGMSTVIVGLTVGTMLGMVAAYRGAIPGLVLMNSMDLILALPGILLVIVIAALLSPSLSTAIVAVGIVNVPYYARLTWASTQEVRVREYVDAACAAGASDARIIMRHILPGVFPPILIQGSLGVGSGILSVSALSFLGVGAQAPTPEWGLMLSEAKRFILTAPHMGIFPGAGIMLAVLSANLIGDGLRDLLDPLRAQG